MTEMGSVAVVADDGSSLADPKGEEASSVFIMGWSNAALFTEPAFELGALDPPAAALYTTEPREYREENESLWPSFSVFATAALTGFIGSDRRPESDETLPKELLVFLIVSTSSIEAGSVTVLPSNVLSEPLCDANMSPVVTLVKLGPETGGL
jgi:hypothetical protein